MDNRLLDPKILKMWGKYCEKNVKHLNGKEIKHLYLVFISMI